MEIRKIGVKKLSFYELKLKLKCNYSEKKKPIQIKVFLIFIKNQFKIERYICPINKMIIVITSGNAGYFV